MNNYSEKKDNVLVELTLLGDEEAYRELVIRHEKAVKGTAYKVTGNLYSAEDASQDAFVSAWVNLDSLRSRDSFKSWVCSIAKNCARNIVVRYNAILPDITLDLQSYEEAGFERIELRGSISVLSDKIKQVVELHYFEGLSVQEIADKLSISAGTVKWRLHEGRKQLRKEYGVMEKDYDENISLVQRVMYQVERLKLWDLKNDKIGFEAEYKQVLMAVEALEDSVEKERALADVLLRGYWWIYNSSNDELFKRIKESALKSRNEDVLMSVAAHEHNFENRKERVDYIVNTQIPFYEAKGFNRVISYLWFWAGVVYCDEGLFEEGIACYKKVTEATEYDELYYAAALSGIESESIRSVNTNSLNFISVVSESYRYVDGKLYFWTQPGYSRGYIGDWNSSILWNCSRCDSLIYDMNMQIGDKVISSDGIELTLQTDKESVSTPAGEFNNCYVYILQTFKNKGVKYVRTVFAPGVGIVEQDSDIWDEKHSWQLSEYEITGGEGLLPLAQGNRWRYEHKDTDKGIMFSCNNSYEIVFSHDDHAVSKSVDLFYQTGYYDTWQGNTLRYVNEYASETKDGGWCLNDVSAVISSAEDQAVTKRQKIYTDIAKDVMNRIFETDAIYNPDYKEKGRWNFFDIHIVYVGEASTYFDCYRSRTYSFEWKDTGYFDKEGNKVLYSSIYDTLDDICGCIWSQDWVPGYHLVKEKHRVYSTETNLTLDVTDDEDIYTPAGEFKGCRHICIDVEGLHGGLSYIGGKMEYWFAPEIGIVRMKHDNCDWLLTKYCGTGEGYFPVSDGLFRRYEPIELGSGYHASVEYTFDEDEEGIVIFKNALGNQDRANYEAAKHKAENEV